MAFNRTAKGTDSDKATGTTLQVASISFAPGALCLVGVTYKSLTVHPTVKFGNRELRIVADSRVSQSDSGITTALYRGLIRKGDSRNLDIVWGSSIDARACFVTEITGAGPKDVYKKLAQTATTNPATGTAVTTTKDKTIHICAFGSNGPIEDTVGTIQVGHASGQRVGTTGGIAASNVTIHETYEELTATGDCRAAKIAATQRRWANTIAAFSVNTLSRQGITPGDLYTIESKFEVLSKDFENATFRFNDAEGYWEVFDSTADLGTAVANNSNFWD